MKSKKNNKVNPKGLKYLEIKDIKKEREIFDSTSPESPFGSSKHAGNTLYFGSYSMSPHFEGGIVCKLLESVNKVIFALKLD